MNILFAASECAPFAKTGGLADVIGALPKALAKQGVNPRVIMPKYEDIPAPFRERMTTRTTFVVALGWRNQYCGIQELEHDGVTYWFVDNEYYFRRKGLYGYGDEAERFAFFSRAVLEALPHLGCKPDVIHCHDWQAGLIPVLLKAHFGGLEPYRGIRTMLTIHNLKYQGIFAREELQDLLSLGDDYFAWDAMGMHGGGSCLKGGLTYADVLTTVSKSYAEEIQTNHYGEQLDGLLRYRSKDLHGIVNGIDEELYDPARDPHIYVNYADSIEDKYKNKAALQAELGLSVDAEPALIGIVSRLVEQKGFDLIERVLYEMLELPVQLVVLGTGEHRFEELFRRFAEHHPKRVSANITFSDALARKIYAGSDLFLMPSQFEPCGIGQLLALRYGTVPIVRETGGLKDTVIPYNKYTEEGTGFTFANYNAHDMLDAVRRALEVRAVRPAWERLARNAARQRFGWDTSAAAYAELYRSLLSR